MIVNPLDEFPDRKQNRINNFDYSENGYYFVTICVENMRNFWFGNVENGEMKLNETGKFVNECLSNLPKFCRQLEIDMQVVMPNHIHVIFAINRNLTETGGQTWRSVPTKFKSISEIVKNFKTFTSRQIHDKYLQINFAWQRSFYDHVIRVDESLEKIRQYILNNPPKWEYDRNNPNRKPGKYYYEY